jgi:hypothetical protein
MFPARTISKQHNCPPSRKQNGGFELAGLQMFSQVYLKDDRMQKKRKINSRKQECCGDPSGKMSSRETSSVFPREQAVSVAILCISPYLYLAEYSRRTSEANSRQKTQYL